MEKENNENKRRYEQDSYTVIHRFLNFTGCHTKYYNFTLAFQPRTRAHVVLITSLLDDKVNYSFMLQLHEFTLLTL